VYGVSYHWRLWSGLSLSSFKAEWDLFPPASALPAICGLLVALIFAGHYALTSDFWAAAQIASVIAAGMAAVPLLNAHRAAQNELDALRAEQKLLAENATDLITRHDVRGAVTFASPAARAVLGVSPSLLLRRGLSGAMSRADAARCQDAITRCIELGTADSVEVEIARGAGARFVEFHCKPMPDGAGAVAVTRDITQRRWHALAMRQAREEAESASRAKSAFIATISHELRTPLNAIIGFSEMLHRDLRTQDGNARHAEYSRIVRESGEHLMSLVNDLLDVSKIEAGRLSICAEPFPVRDAITSSVDTLRPAFAAKSIVLDVSISDDLVEMTADRRACKQMLMNLLSNACKFTPSGGHIELLAGIEGENAVLSVRDNGIGIAKDHVTRLGEPFYQVDSSYARQLEGAGLGLAIVRGLAELHGGRLEVESALGEGSCFRLVLPLDVDATSPAADVTPDVPDVGEDPVPTPQVALVA